MELKKALAIAVNLIETLEQHCEPGRCLIAGSCRRQKPEVKDIEICCSPFLVADQDLFGGATEPQRTAAWKVAVNGLGTPVKGNPDGKYMQIKLPEGINLDLFMPDPWDFFRQAVIRTGSADWVSRFVAGGWRNLGWCGSDAGLRLQTECVSKTSETDGKKSWKCIVPKSEQTLPPAWKSEREFFAWINLPWIPPEEREVK